MRIDLNALNERNEKIEKLKEILSSEGVERLSYLIRNSVKMNKKGNPLANSEVTKEQVARVKPRTSYVEEVNAKRLVEGKTSNFEPADTWHDNIFTGINGNILTSRKTSEANKKIYVSGVIEEFSNLRYYIDGVPANEEQVKIIKTYLPGSKSYVSKTQNLEEEVIYRTFDIENILEVIINE